MRDKSFVCEVCNKVFPRAFQLKRHVPTHTRKTYECDVCMIKFTTYFNLQRHLPTHDEVKKSFTCKVRGKLFSDAEKLERRKKLHTEVPYLCSLCYRGFETTITLNEHWQTHTGEKPFHCGLCDQLFTSRPLLVEHLHTHTGDEPFECAVCSRKFSVKVGLRKHQVTHIKEEHDTSLKTSHHPVNSETTGFSRKVDMDIHRDKEPFEKFTGNYNCEECNKSFPDEYKLKIHLEVHSGLRIHQCNVCCRRFTSATSLKTHSQIHTGEKPFQCQLCDQFFRNKTLLRKHLHTHSGDKPFECELCSKKFAIKQGLQRHLETHLKREHRKSIKKSKKPMKSETIGLPRVSGVSAHLGEKTFECEMCLKKFAVVQELQSHKLTHLNEECCTSLETFHQPVISETVGFPRMVEVNTHEGEKPFGCEVCLKKFAVVQELQSHKLTHLSKECGTSLETFHQPVISETIGFPRMVEVNTHKGEKPFSCEVCLKKFAVVPELQSHKLTHMSEECGSSLETSHQPANCETTGFPRMVIVVILPDTIGSESGPMDSEPGPVESESITIESGSGQMEPDSIESETDESETDSAVSETDSAESETDSMESEPDSIAPGSEWNPNQTQ